MSDVSIRPVRAEDAEAVNEIRRQPSVLDYTLSLSSERIARNRTFIEGLGEDDHVFVAEMRGRVVGLAGLHVGRGKRRHVGAVGISVHDDFQGQGIGARLMDALLDVADSYLGLVRVELEVFADNARAIKLYERLGFQTEGAKRKDAYHRGEYIDVLVMGRVR